MFLDHGLSGFGSCFIGGVFGMPKRFLGCQIEDDNVVFQFDLDVKVLLEQRLEDPMKLAGYI